jgi:hypothetical protein
MARVAKEPPPRDAPYPADQAAIGRSERQGPRGLRDPAKALNASPWVDGCSAFLNDG